MPNARKSLVDLCSLIASVNGVTRDIKFRKDQVVFAQGETADSVFYIQEGKLKITVLSEKGKEAAIAILEAGDFCGEGCLGGQTMRKASVVAMTDCVVTRLEKASILRLIHESEEFSCLFMAYLLSRNIRAEADLVNLLFNSSEKRLARLLLTLANFGKDGRPQPIIPAISQETLAEMIGTTRSRVSFFMNKFRQLGFIDYDGHIEVHASLLNVILHDDSARPDK